MVKSLTNDPATFMDSLEDPEFPVRGKCVPDVDVGKILLRKNWPCVFKCSLKFF